MDSVANTVLDCPLADVVTAPPLADVMTKVSLSFSTGLTGGLQLAHGVDDAATAPPVVDAMTAPPVVARDESASLFP